MIFSIKIIIVINQIRDTLNLTETIEYKLLFIQVVSFFDSLKTDFQTDLNEIDYETYFI